MSDFEPRSTVWLVWFFDDFLGAYADEASAMAAFEEDLAERRALVEEGERAWPGRVYEQRSRKDYLIYAHEVLALAPPGDASRAAP